MMAALMSEEAHRTFKVTQYCHPDEYNDEVMKQVSTYIHIPNFSVT